MRVNNKRTCERARARALQSFCLIRAGLIHLVGDFLQFEGVLIKNQLRTLNHEAEAFVPFWLILELCNEYNII